MGIEGGKQRLPSTDVCENDMLNYCKEMSCLLSNISVQVKAAQGKVAERFLHEVRPGDFVVIRDHRRKSWRSKKVARALPGASGDAHGSEGRREGYVGSR